MTQLRSEEVMHSYLTEVVGGGNLAPIQEFTAADMIDHTQPELRGPQALEAHVRQFRGNMPDLEVEVIHIAATDDIAIGVWRWAGTPSEPIWGHAASGSPIKPSLIASIFYFKNDMLVEYRPFVDAVEILGQISDAG